MVNGGHKQGSGGGGGSESGLKSFSENFPIYADQLQHSHNNQFIHNGHRDIQVSNFSWWRLCMSLLTSQTSCFCLSFMSLDVLW